MNAKGQIWNENIKALTRPSGKIPRKNLISKVGAGTNIQSKQANVPQYKS